MVFAAIPRRTCRAKWAADCGRSDGSFASADSMSSAERRVGTVSGNGGLVETPHLDVSTNPLCSYRPNAYSLLFGVPKPKLLYPEPQYTIPLEIAAPERRSRRWGSSQDLARSLRQSAYM